MMKIVFPFSNSQRSHLDVGLLSAYLDAQVTPAERRRVERHLAECAACRRELAELRQTVTLLQALPRIPTPRAFTLAEVQVGRGRPANQTAWFGGLLRGLAAVSTVAIVVVLAATLLRRGDRQPSTELARVVAPAMVTTDASPQAAAPAPAHEAAPTAAPAAPRAAEAMAAPTKAPAAAEKAVPAATPRRAAAPAPAAAAPTLPAMQAVPTETRATDAPPRPAELAPALAAAPPTRAAAPSPTDAAAPAARSAPVATAPATAGAAGPTINAENAARPDGRTPTIAAQDTAGLRELPPTFAAVFVRDGDLWAVERGGVRRIAQAVGLAAPVVSPDRAWIAYRRPGADGAEVWIAPWANGEPRRLLTERDLQTQGLAGYRPAAIEDVQWSPTGRTLVVTTVAMALAPDAAPRMELWTVEIETATQRLVTHSDIAYPPRAAPDGASFVFLRRAAENPAAADVWLVATDGTTERALLRIPLPADVRDGRTQLHWLPDGRGFWLALGERGPTGLLLYRVMRDGAVAAPIRLDARQAFWSADGNRLAYVTPADGAAGVQDLFVAAADGIGARRYTTLLNGRFVAWSPDSVQFLYEDGGHLFVGGMQEAPTRLASDVREARWVGAGQVMYVTEQGDSRQLVYRALTGRPIVLQTLPADASLDGLWP